MFVNKGSYIYKYTLSDPFDISTASETSSYLNAKNSVTGMQYNNDGTKLFLVNQTSTTGATAKIWEFSLSTAYDPTTGSSNVNWSDPSTYFETGETVGSAGNGVPTQFITFNNDGSKFFSFNHTIGYGSSDPVKIKEWNLASPFNLTNDVSGKHSGDVINTSSTDNYDTDPDSDTLTITSIIATTAGGSAQTTFSSNTEAVTGSYGILTINSNGSYQYAATLDATDALDAGDVVTDVFTYIVSDGQGETDTATITITVIGVNDAPTASNGTVNINENNQASTAGDRTPSNITKVFAASDFSFADTDGGSLSKVKITTLESAGALEYNNGSSWVDVTEDQEITASDIGNNKLRFTPVANSESNPYFSFKVHDGTDYSSSAYTMTISVNAAPNVTDATVGSTVAAGGTSSGDVHDGVADSDDDDSVLVVTGVASGNESSNNTIITNNTGVGSAVSGTYGSLTVAADGTYTYTASATNNIAYGATATDIFTFTTRDDESNSGSNAYDVGSITFTVASSISLTDDTDSATEGTAITVTGVQDDVLNDDAADTNGLVVTNISHTNGNTESGTASTTHANGQSIAGTYGTLVIGADGSYTFTPNDVLGASETGDDVFTYTADGATATLTITVTGINDDPTAVNDTGYIKEGGTLTVANSAAASSGTSTGNHTGDITDNDTDADASSTATITSITATTASGGAQTTFSSDSETVTGQYGTLTINSNGSYSYAANSNISGLDAGDANITDVFTYIVSDGTATSTATLTINVIASQDLTARNDTGTVNEDATLTVSNSSNATTVSAASLVQSKSISGAGETRFNNDGTKMFVLRANSYDDIQEWTLTTPHDVSTASLVDSFDISSQHTNATGFKFNGASQRKELGLFPKYHVISSHDLRRSFATNFFGKIPTPILMNMTGHAKESTFMGYIGRDPNRDSYADAFMEGVKQM